MVEVRWTLQAADDLESIAQFIGESSDHYAQFFVMDVLAATERLASFPESGRIVPEFNKPSIREVLLGSYRIVYRSRSQSIEVLTVHHGARLLKPGSLT